MAWQPNEQVTFVSHTGEKSTREVDEVTLEGFAILKFGHENEFVFTPSGTPTNATVDPMTGGPKIHKIKGQTKGSFNDPWHNEFALETFTIMELKKMLDILIKDNRGNEKLNLRSCKSSAKIKEMFDKKQGNKPSAKKRHYRKKK